jgi:hypothetical protein
MWTVFPSSDYYEGSVTIGFSTGRPSRLYAYETWSALRCPLVSLPELTVPSPSERALTRLTPMSEYSDGVASRMLRRGYALPQWKLGFVRQTHHTHRTCGATVTSFHCPSLSGHARVPFEFPRQVRPCPRGRLLPTSPFCERYLMCVETAHGVCISKREKCTLSQTGCLADLLNWLPKRIEEKGFEAWKVCSLVRSLW